ncbi:relaxase/mobilization nuclease domain-containing protein [Suilimivivens aceti]|uniref:Relaxase/mobilization nuclease domain-containing protein n=2 Tax=Suilimivivens aceti TaxID=2981774 RepID=A0ABT2T3P1_9FIRM|nr:relaxase/mobilization nuclease domain-containing protein [Suilimivivens aceti]
MSGARRGRKYKEWQSDQNGSAWKTQIRKDINFCIKPASTYEEFLLLMRDKGYEIKGETFEEGAAKYISFRPLDKERFVRGSARSLGKEYTKERIGERIERKRERKAVIPKKDYSARRLIDTSDEKFQNSPELQRWAAIENLKIAAQSYNEVGSLAELEYKIAAKTEAGKSAKQSVVELEHRIKDLAEIIKYTQQYKANRSYHIGYKKAKNPDAYFRRYESQIILYGGARRMLEQAGINLKGLNVDKLKAEYQELMKQKSELTSTYKDCEKEVRELKRKQENLNQYLGRTQPDPAQEQQTKKDTPNL